MAVGLMRLSFFRQKIGQEGETQAAVYLRRNGYRIVTRNYRNRYGEIDIIARERDVICFVEVKTRSSAQFGCPAEAVSWRKQEKIRRLALVFLQERGWEDAQMRFDIVSVIAEPGLAAPRIELIKDAFECPDDSPER